MPSGPSFDSCASKEFPARPIAACGKDEQSRRDYAIVLALLDTELRASEFVALDVGDVGGTAW